MSEKLNFQIISNEPKAKPTYKELKVTNKKFIFWGEKNDFPNQLFDMYLNSTVLQSIIEGVIDYSCGAGCEFKNASMLHTYVNSDEEELIDVIKKLYLDYMIFGGYAMNILRDSENRISEIYWLDMRNIRLSEDGKTAFYSENSFSWGDKPLELPVFDSHKQQKSSVYYFSGHISRGLYPIPRWNGAIRAVQTSAEISNYHLNSILNNFNPSALISFNNGVPTVEEQKEIEKKINKKFTGSNNVNRFVLSFSDNGENATTIQSLGSDNADQKFKDLKESIFDEIFIAFRATPALFGMNPENTGFSKTEFMESFELFNKTVIQPIQKDMCRSFDKIFGITDSIELKSFKVYDDDAAVISNEPVIENE